MPKSDWPFAGSPLVLSDRLILNLGAVEKEAGIVALDLSDGKTIWEATDHGYAHTTPTAATIDGQQRVFVLTFEGLVCLNPKDGTVDWEVAHQVRDPTGMNGTNAVSPVVIDDRVCVVSGPKVKPGLRCFQVLPDGTYEETWRAIWLSPKRLIRDRDCGIGSYSKIPICVSFWIWLALVGMNFYGVSVILEVNSTLLKILQIYVKTVRINCS